MANYKEEGVKPASLLVMPVSGKYCEIISGSESFKIWKVHPNTPDTYGTRIPYDVGVHFLSKTPPVITLVPVVKNGKFVSQLLDEDQASIQEALDRGFSGGKNYNEDVSKPVDVKDPQALEKTAKLLQEQIAKNADLETKLQDLATRLGLLETGTGGVPTGTGES